MLGDADEEAFDKSCCLLAMLGDIFEIRREGITHNRSWHVLLPWE
jgi:hypothetical protein